MSPTPPARRAAPSRSYRRGLVVGVFVAALAGLLGYAAGDAAAVVVLSFGLPVGVGVAAGPVVITALAILAVLAVFAFKPAWASSRGYTRGATVGLLAAVVLYFSARLAGGLVVALIRADGWPAWTRLLLVPLVAVPLVLLVGAGVVALGRRLD